MRISFVILALLCASLAPAVQITGSESAGEFFDKVGGTFLRDQLGLDLHHISIYPTNQYSPEVQRLLQVTANLYDTTTNRGDAYPFFPTLFRPTFATNGVEVFISGYVEEAGTAFLNRPSRRPVDPNDRPIAPDDNVDGIPIILGAKKGLPNFNEFVSQSLVQFTRKIQVRKATANGRPIETNQMFIVGISNTFAIEAWNSYMNAYPRSLELRSAVVSTCNFTNDDGLNLSATFSTNFNLAITPASWAAQQFRIPLVVGTTILPDSFYRRLPDTHFDPPAQTNLFESGFGLYTNRWGLTTTTRISFFILDGERIIDCVVLPGLNTAFDLSDVLNKPFDIYPISSPISRCWSIAPAPGGYEGALRQLQVSLGDVNASADWSAYGLNQLPPGGDREKAIDTFRAFLGFAPLYNQTVLPPTNLVMDTPFIPTRQIFQATSWQANDPLVHHCLHQLISGGTNALATAGLLRLGTGASSITNGTSLARINDRYRPWGGSPLFDFDPSDPFPYDHSVKDPGVWSPEYWNFPSGSSLNIGSLGQVHRGTPWQSLYLKSAAASADDWLMWSGGASGHPTNDWHLISLLASMLQTNPPQSLPSINSANPATWGSALDGITVKVITNSPDCTISDLTFHSDSPEVGLLADALNSSRALFPNGYFREIGDLLATPELSVSSPWINIGDPYCTADADIESLASQLLGGVRPDPLASLTFSNHEVQVRFTSFPNNTYEIQSSPDLHDWTGRDTITPKEDSFIYSDPDGLASGQRFYRLKLIR